MTHLSLRVRAAAVVPTLLALCLSGGAAVVASGDVATLGSPAPGATAAPDGGTAPVDPQAALLAYARCMREHGVDMPDPQVSTDGTASLVSAIPLGGGDVDPAVTAAQEACQALLEAGLPPVDPQLQAEMQQQFLGYAGCMRDHGVDMPDPRILADGSMSIDVSGQDPTSATYQAAQQACGGGSGLGVTTLVDVPADGGSGTIQVSGGPAPTPAP